VAYALSVLDSDDLSHPALEVLITTDEEKGLTGADKVDGSLFKSKYLLNLDSEDEGVFTCGCAGGCEVKLRIPTEYQGSKMPAFRISVKGLTGGHSGTDIDKEKGNANKILGRILNDIFDISELISINGGSKGNAIPREAQAVIASDNIEQVRTKVTEWNEILKNEYAFTDSLVELYLDALNTEEYPLKKDVFRKTVSAVNLIPNGALSRSTVINLVISSNNLGVITQDEEFITVHNQARSSVSTLLTHNVASVMEQIGEALNIECIVGGFYPGWEYAKESRIRDICIDTYRQVYGKEAKVEAIHAGLECGLLMEKIDGLDAISMGPNAYDVHSPDEHISIQSTENVYNLLCEILKRIK